MHPSPSFLLLLLLQPLTTYSCSPRSTNLDVSGAAYSLTGDVCPVHDPSIAFDGSLFHVFSTDYGPILPQGYIPHRCSRDGRAWTLCGAVFPTIPAWVPALIPDVPNLWAPDISFNGSHWLLYYVASQYGQQNSAIALATNLALDPASPAFRWVDHGPVFTTKNGDPYNAIDPSRFTATDGSHWLSFGSYWEGIFALPLDPATSAPVQGSAPVHLAQRSAPDQLEASAPFLANGSIWLLTSWNSCCEGVNSTYEARIGRAPSFTGAPSDAFADVSGVPLLQGGGSLVAGHGFGWAAAGGQSPLRQVGGESLVSANQALAMHAYDGKYGDPWLNLVNLTFSPSRPWPSLTEWQ